MLYDARIKIEFSKVNEANYDAFLAEFNGLNYHKSLQSFRFRAQKLDFSKEEALLFEMLCDIKKDILELKNLKAQSFLELENSSFSAKIGFEEIEFCEEILEPGELYYARLVLESFTIALFLRARDFGVASIEKIKRYDEESFNQFITETQRNLIYQKKDANAARYSN